jgi:hypothetical protein
MEPIDRRGSIDRKGAKPKRIPPGYMSSEDIEQAKRAARARERDLVLAQMEYLEDTDPKYQRPAWISRDETSTRRREGRTWLTEDERYPTLDQNLFEKTIDRFFPRPRDH